MEIVQAQQLGPLVSIGVPTYNRVNSLEKALLSLLDQSYTNIEIIVSDNASNDETVEVCNRFKELDRRITFFRQEKNLGPVANFEFVRRQSTGKYFMWLADDDLLTEGYIAACVHELESDEDLALVAGRPRYYRDGALAFLGKTIQLQSKNRYLRVISYLWRVSDNGIYYGVYRAAAFEKCDLPNVLGGDWAWVMEIAFLGKVKTLDHSFVDREIQGTSVTYEQIVQTMELPSWNRVFPRLAISLELTRHILYRSKVFSEISLPFRVFLSVCVLMAFLLRRVKYFLNKIIGRKGL